jgi:DtxR family transcriptional regulator, Mn-dependent transcriptional regulator
MIGGVWMEDMFHTVRGYEMQGYSQRQLTPALEDYLEMIYRQSFREPFIRINSLAQFLHVKDPSASKMVKKLGDLGFVFYEKYGIVTLTQKGRDMGAFLLMRHGVLETFFTCIGCKQQLDLAEQMEHFLAADAVENIKMVTGFLNSSPAVADSFVAWKQEYFKGKQE